MFLPQLIQDAALDGFQVTTYIIYKKLLNFEQLEDERTTYRITLPIKYYAWFSL